ncbi:AAA family ATPase [Magnetofaba australis]|uniref:Putative TOPRIM domain-containing protein n=1 Tax=Magnetofaba australis IT-1 TaxID=1434232 RepID=A0A1Y2KA30_9PROT|nr:AAA family ATPase [Magnetofaba australis]OSM07371.1 putative TOPRIM domain-containing protein [Magnetofaba australis IT-1]
MIGSHPYLDFNDAEPQSELPGITDRAQEKEEIKTRLLGRVEEALRYLMPAGKVRHGQFHIGDVAGAPGESMKVELSGEKAGVWYDHAEGKGGDILDLWARSRGIDPVARFGDVMDEVRAWLGDPMRVATSSTPPRQKNDPPMDDLGPHTGKWDYFDADGQLLVCVYRYDPPGKKKQFRPWDVQSGKWQAPASHRPLYNLPGIAQADDVVLVEGEKTAQALVDIGITATTSMHGSNAPVEKTDWSPLRGKRLIIWPDRDKPGWEYAQSASKAMKAAGAKSISILIPPEDKPEKWDAADAVAEGMDIQSFLRNAQYAGPDGPKRRIRLRDWTFDRYLGPAPERRWLIDGVLPLGIPGMVAAIGGAGKSMLLMDLCAKVAQVESGSPMPMEALGGPLVSVPGTAVMFTAEDDADEVHRRLAGLVGALPDPSRLIVVPLPNAGGAIPLVAMGREGPVLTDAYEEMRAELLEIPDLRLVVIDPLQSFAGGDVNSDPAAGAMFFAGLGRLAAETGSTTLVAHHFRKVGMKPIHTAAEAREAIRGTTALVDGGRWSYALWEADSDEAEKVCEKLNRRYQRDSVYKGAVVKSNWPTDKTIRTYVREPSIGLLQERSIDLALRVEGNEDLSKSLAAAVGRAAANGQPFTKSGVSGLFERRSELPGDLQDYSKHRLTEIVESLLSSGGLVQCIAPGSRLKKWLDVPGGEFALGVGEFQLGSGPTEENVNG